MSEAKFTRGPWWRHYSPNGQEFVICDRRRNGGYAIASLDGSCSKANAHLIATSPEMYEALEHILENQALGSPLALSINNLLAKARGE